MAASLKPKFSRVVVTGSIAFDHIMSMPGKFGDHIMPDKIHVLNVSFIMKTFRKEFGGTGGNMAYSLGMLGIPTVLVGSVGNDFGEYRIHLEQVKDLDISRVHEWEDSACAQGFVMTDREDNQIWGFYEGAMGKETELSLREVLQSGDLLIVGPNNPAAMMQYVREAWEAEVPYLFDPAFNIAHFTGADLLAAVEKAEIVIGNDYEIELIQRRLGWTKQDWEKVAMVVTTLGSHGSRIRQGAEMTEVPVAKVEAVMDPTGAGDAFRAGLVAGYVSGRGLSDCGRMGAVSAAYTVEKYGTQTHQFDRKSFTARLRRSFS